MGIFSGYGMAYVALSRVRNISCLALTDFDKTKIKTSKFVKGEMKRLTEERRLPLRA